MGLAEGEARLLIFSEHPMAVLTFGLNSGQVSSGRLPCHGLKVITVLVDCQNSETGALPDGNI